MNLVCVHVYFLINITNNPGKPGSLLASHMQTEPKIFNPGVNIYEVSVPPFHRDEVVSQCATMCTQERAEIILFCTLNVK